MREMNAYRILVGNPEERNQLGIPRRRWEDNVGIDWIDVAQDRDQWRALVYTVMNLWVS
jgi:hypothetical protein